MYFGYSQRFLYFLFRMIIQNWKTPWEIRDVSSATGYVAGKPGAIPVLQDMLS
ncbi:hypothetical protein [Aquimarina sp. AU58]|uniref:hypothetical protein n=1 Tax=Aquimarina sp. AU58 TaxID=1874112 RepID=UPI001357FAAD|nr:hypothetical protein [Aquimarina sp. AU58]